MNELAYWLVVARERVEASRWMRRAIAAGDARGFDNATRLLRDGDEATVRTATEWLRLVAATGSDEALTGALEDLNTVRPEGRMGSQLALRARLGELVGVEASLTEPSLLRAVVRLLLGRRDEASDDLERVGAHTWLAGLGADPSRHWLESCEELAARSPVEGDVLAARLHLGRQDPSELRSWAERLPVARPDRDWQRLFARLHIGLDAERRGDRVAARRAYADLVAVARRATDQTPWMALDTPEHVWAEARLRTLD